MALKAVRKQSCGRDQALVRLDNAQKFLEVAELIVEEQVPSSLSVAAALAVLSGIASADAACCTYLKERSRGQDHREAVVLLRRVLPGGQEAANDLSRLLELKDAAHYGVVHVSGQKQKAALRQASNLVRFASAIVEP